MADLIDRKTAIEAILSIKDYGNSERANALGLAELAITTLPSAQPECKTGRWLPIPDSYSFFYTIPVCSECGCTTLMRTKTPFCPNCGAKMEEGDG